MTKMSKKQYQKLAEKVGPDKMKEIEEASGVSTGLLDSASPAKAKGKPKDSKVSINLDCTKDELLKAMREEGCTVADYNIVKFGKPDYVLVGHKETKAQMEQIVNLHEELTNYLMKSFETALKIGEILCNLKENHIKRKKFGAWMKQNLPFSVRTGQRYMQIYVHHEELEKKGIVSLADAYREINGEPLDGDIVEVDDGTDTSKKWVVESTDVEVDNIKLPKKKIKGLQETVQINGEILERMEQGQCPFDGKYIKIVATIPSHSASKALLPRYVIAADNLLASGGKLIFVKRKNERK